MSDPVSRLVEAIDHKDVAGIRAAYAPGARLVAMTPNTFQVRAGVDEVVEKMAEFFASWEEEPHYSLLGTVREGDRAVVEFERTSAYEGAAWVVRQAHVLQFGPGGIEEHRIYCCGPREGGPELAAVYAAEAVR